eukprot:592147-Pleurochrysis_carterae.AAC.1
MGPSLAHAQTPETGPRHTRKADNPLPPSVPPFPLCLLSLTLIILRLRSPPGPPGPPSTLASPRPFQPSWPHSRRPTLPLALLRARRYGGGDWHI